MAVEIGGDGTNLSIGAVTRLFGLSLPNTNQGWLYDVAPEGRRFLMVVPSQVQLDGPPALAFPVQLSLRTVYLDAIMNLFSRFIVGWAIRIAS
jgi:transposase InsO family protein